MRWQHPVQPDAPVAAVAAHLGMKCVLVQENWARLPPTRCTTAWSSIEMSLLYMGADVRLDATRALTSASPPTGSRPWKT